MPPILSFTSLGSLVILYYTAPQGGLNAEFDMNEMVNYTQTNLKTSPTEIKDLWKAVFDPSFRFDNEPSNLKMAPKASGPLRPAHLPSIKDWLEMDEKFKILLDWYFISALEKEDSQTLLSSFLMHLIDPEPVINFAAPPFIMQDDDLRLWMASFCDAFQVVYLPSAPRFLHLYVIESLPLEVPSYTCAVIQPIRCNRRDKHMLLMPPATKLVCWNVRGVGRPSFVRNFNFMLEMHHPDVVILLEIRNSVGNLVETIARLGGNFSYAHSVLNSFEGGAALLWRSEVLQTQTYYQGPGSLCILEAYVQATWNHPNFEVEVNERRLVGMRIPGNLIEEMQGVNGNLEVFRGYGNASWNVLLRIVDLGSKWKYSLEDGWKNFVTENDIRLGDVLKIYLCHNTCVRVRVFRASVEIVDPIVLAPNVVEEDRPWFLSTFTRSYMHLGVMSVPIEFARENFMNFPEDTAALLRFGDNEWDANSQIERDGWNKIITCSINKGITDLIQQKNIQAKQEFVVEFYDDNPPIFHMYYH